MPPTEHVRHRIMNVIVATFKRINATSDPASWFYTVKEVHRGRVSKEQVQEFPAILVGDGREVYDDRPHPLYSRALSVPCEALLKVDDPGADPSKEVTRFLADVERALGANEQLEETLGVPATKLAIVALMEEAIPFIDYPANPFVTVVFSVKVLYRTLRADPGTPK